MNVKDKKVLVTGATGLIGSHLTEDLAEAGADVTAVKHVSEPRAGQDTTVAKWIQADLTDPTGLDGVVQGQEIVFHFAAFTSGAFTTVNDPMAHVTENVVMNARLFAACYRHGIEKVIYPSSTTGYPNAPHEMTEDMMQEGEPHPKYFHVGHMKRFSEKLGEMYQQLDRPMPIIVLRPTNIFGPRDKTDLNKCHVLPAMVVKLCQRKVPLDIWGDGTDVRDFLYVKDMTAAAIAATKLDEHTCINIGMGATYSINQIIDMIETIEDWHPPHDHIDGPRMIHTRLVSIAKAKQLLDWEPQVDIMTGLKRTIDWYKTWHSPSTTSSTT